MNTSVVVAATSFTATTPYLQSEWLLDTIGRPLQDGMSFAASSSSPNNSLTPRWAMEAGSFDQDSKCRGNGHYVSAQTNVAYTYSSYRVVLFIDLDDSMLAVASDGSISFDAMSDQLSALLDALRIISRDKIIPIQLSICTQHVDNGAVKTLYEGLLSTFARAVTPAQIRKMLFRHLSQLSVSIEAVRGQMSPLEFVLNYSVSHLKLMPEEGCPLVFYVTSGLRTADVRKCSSILSAMRISLNVLIVRSLGGGDTTTSPLDEIALCTGGNVFDIRSDVNVMSQQLLRPLYYKPLPTETKRGCAHRQQLRSYELDGLMFQHVVALRLMDGFHLIGAFSEAGRYLDSSSSERRLAYKYTFRFQIKLSNLTALIYEISCLIFQKAPQTNIRRQRSARTSFRASRGHYTPVTVTLLSAPLPSEWSSAICNHRFSRIKEVAMDYERKDMALADEMRQLIKLFDCSNVLRPTNGGHSRGSSDQPKTISRSLTIDMQKSMKADSMSPIVGQTSNIGGEVSARLLPLVPALEQICGLDVVWSSHIYIRGVDLLTDLSRNNKFKDIVITNILGCFGRDCTCYNYSNLNWLLVAPTKSGTEPEGSMADAARNCPDMMLVKICHTSGVFMNLTLSRFRVGPPRKTFFFNKEPGIDGILTAVSGALGHFGFKAEVSQRDLLAQYVLSSKSNIEKGVRTGKLTNRCVEYPLDFSDPLVFSSIVNELSTAKSKLGFQVCVSFTDSTSGIVLMHFCAAVPAMLCDTLVKTLIQCHILCRPRSVVVQYLTEQEYPQFMLQKSNKKLGIFVSLCIEQDESIMKLYSALISMFNQYRQRVPRRLNSTSSAMKLRLSRSQWELLVGNSDPTDYLLPSFEVDDIQAANNDLASMLSCSLVENDGFMHVNIDDSQSDAVPYVLCKKIDGESILIIELLTILASGTVEIEKNRDNDSDATDLLFSEHFESCLPARFRLFRLPMLRSHLKSELLGFANHFDMTSESAEEGANGQSQAILPLTSGNSTTVSPVPALSPLLSHRTSSGRVTKLFKMVLDSIFRFHLHNYAVVLYARIRNDSYIPRAAELSTALHNCRVLSHELDISTMCAAKRSALKMAGRVKTVCSTVQAFRSTLGGVLVPIPNSEYFIYTPQQGTSVVPLFVKFDYVLVSQNTSTPFAGNAEAQSDELDVNPNAQNPEYNVVDDDGDQNISTSVGECFDKLINDECNLADTVSTLPQYASDDRIAKCIVNLSEGRSPSGDVIGDASDYIMRVEFFLPQRQSFRYSNRGIATLHGLLKRRVNAKFESRRDHRENRSDGLTPFINAEELTRTSYADFSSATSILASELDTFISLDVLESLAIEDSPTPETLVLAQHCLNIVPGVLVRTVSLDVVSPASLSSRNLPDVAINRILKFLDVEIQFCLKASKIGDVYYIRRWKRDVIGNEKIDETSPDYDSSTSILNHVEGEVNAWILLSLVNTSVTKPTDSLEKMPITTIEMSITFRLLDESSNLRNRQAKAMEDLLKSLESVCIRVNQRTLLYDLLQTHTASNYLLQDAVAEQPEDKPAPRSTSGRHRPPVPTNEMRYAKAPTGLIAEREKNRVKVERTKMGADEHLESTDGPDESAPQLSAMSYKSFKKGTFSCPVQGSVNCTLHSMQNFNIDIAIRQLEKLAFDPLVILNAKSRFVYSKDGAIYYMAFNQQKREEKQVQLDIYGVSSMAPDMKDQLQNLLESKLAEYTASLISEVIAAFSATTKVHIRQADINFLKDRGAPRSVSISVMLPEYIGDPLYFLSLARQLLLATPNVQSCYELLGTGDKKKSSRLSSVYHPACFGHNLLRKKFIPSLSPGEQKNTGSEVLEESVHSFRPLLKRKARVEIEDNDPNHMSPVFFHRPRAEQLPRSDIRFHESSSLWAQDDYRFLYSYTGGRSARGEAARGESKQFGVGLAVIELELKDFSEKDELHIYRTGSKDVLLKDMTTMFQYLKRGTKLELQYAEQHAPISNTVTPPFSKGVTSRSFSSRTMCDDDQIGTNSGSPTVPSTEAPDDFCSIRKSHFGIVLTIIPTSDINTNILMKYCRKCLDDALMSYCGERILSSGQHDASKCQIPSSIHPDLYNYDDLLRSLHDLLYLQQYEHHTKGSEGGGTVPATPLNSYGCLQGALTLSRASALVLQQTLLDEIYTDFSFLKETLVACNCSPLFSSLQNKIIMKRTSAGAAPKWASLKQNKKEGVFHSSVVVGNMFPSHDFGVVVGNSFIPSGNAVLATSMQPAAPPVVMAIQTHLPRAANQVPTSSLQHQASYSHNIDSFHSSMQLMNDDTSASSNDCTAPIWLRRRRSLLEISINTEGWFIFYFNINPRVIQKLNSLISSFASMSIERALTFGATELKKIGLFDEYTGNGKSSNLAYQNFNSYSRVQATMVEVPNSDNLENKSQFQQTLPKIVIDKLNLVLRLFRRFSWGQKAMSKLFIPHSDSKHGELFDGMPKKNESEFTTCIDNWRKGVVDFCQEFPLPLFGKHIDNSRIRQYSHSSAVPISNIDKHILDCEDKNQATNSFELYIQAITNYIRDDKFGNFDIHGNPSSGTVFVVAPIPCKYCPSSSAEILSITELHHAPGDVLRIVHRLSYVETILAGEVLCALQSNFDSSKSPIEEYCSQIQKYFKQLKGQLGLDGAPDLEVGLGLLEIREYKSLKRLHKRLYLEILGLIYRSDVNSMGFVNCPVSGPHRNLDAIRWT